jgi:hypothetical protein
MKTTVKKKQEEKKQVPFDKIPVGAVYVAGNPTGPLVLGKAVLLANYVDDDKGMATADWFKIADGFKGKPAYEILGKLTEIIVEEY